MIFRNIKTQRIIVLVIFDIIAVNLAAFMALLIRHELSFANLMASGFVEEFEKLIPVITVSAILMFAIFRLYSSLWEYAGVNELVLIALASAAATILQTAVMIAIGFSLPRSFPLLYCIMVMILITFERFSYRFIRKMKREKRINPKKRTMIIGAGEAGAAAIREFKQSPNSQNRPVCVIDDEPSKQGKLIRGVKIAGGRNDIADCADKYQVEEIVLAIPGAPNREKKKIIGLCQETGCAIKTLPSISQLANGEVSIQKIRNVEIEDLLGREEVKTDMGGISEYITGKRVLVTGGGGSIGSELCRQIASYAPEILVIFDIYENNAYALQQELMNLYPELDLKVMIGSVRDINRLNYIFSKYRPDIVYHAAAHKHVPLMEDSPGEAIKNNVMGTYNVAQVCDTFGVGKMVLISTDKAVRPTNIMGASKRICEMIVQMFDRKSETSYVAVRFGNVLGSNGSVIPLFKKQIERGGPVTVTHKDIIRYFMTIPEAVSLILQAGAYATGGEIFVLDMGEPVKIDELARNMIRLSGFEPGTDIEIKYTGLRPGEKLYEELLLSEEGLKKTPNDLIFIGRPLEVDEEKMTAWLDKMEKLANNNFEEIKTYTQEIVRDYKITAV